MLAPWIASPSGYVERYRGPVRHEWLDQYLFESSQHAKETATDWLWRYNKMVGLPD